MTPKCCLACENPWGDPPCSPQHHMTAKMIGKCLMYESFYVGPKNLRENDMKLYKLEPGK